MFRNTLSFSVAVLLAGAMLFAAPDASEAQRGGRGRGVHFGGARGGGYHGSFIGRGFPSGRFHGGYISRYYHGGYNHAYYRGGYYLYRGLNGYYGRHYPFYGIYGGYYPYYSSYGYYGGYPYFGASYPYYGGYQYGYPGWNYNPGYYSSYQSDYDGDTTPPYVSYGTNTLLESSGNSAVVHVHVPLALADVAFDGKLTTTTGKDRVFTTPELTPGKTYTYTVTANWTEGGVARNESRTVHVQAGQSSTVDFSKNQ
jgi:uncharacterized protein (TIGR03000 family)